MKKLILSSICFAFFATATNAQIKYNLDLLSDRETYMVSMVSEKSYKTPRNMTSNVQVVIKIPFGKKFFAGEIESRIPGISFTDNSYFDDPDAIEPGQLIAFTMIESDTKAIQFKEGEELPLFTFKNLEEECVGLVKLVETDNESVKKALTQGLNFTQNMTVIGARGNAYQGIENGEVDCSVSGIYKNDPIATDIKAYPVPVTNILNIEWTNLESYENLRFELFNGVGELLKTTEIDPKQGFKTIQANVSAQAAGLYGFRLRNEKEAGRMHKFIVVQ